uniref:EF-hand domain-containing protein n=1 Tax=Syphacia muris TaxID=451379 RepID=A0A0N5AGA7_9BILA
MDKAANGKWEMALQPPTMEELQKTVGNVFDVKWIKYIYAHFKNECPSGKMRLSAFKNLFYQHLPEGVSDEYIQRLFFAFSFGECEVTFESLLETLAMLKTSSAIINAKWTMRLISGSETKPVSYEVRILDRNDNGLIEVDELVAFFEVSLKSL